MKPTPTANDRLKPSHHIIQSPPTNANGSDSMTIRASVIDLKFRYSNAKMIFRVDGYDDFQAHGRTLHTLRG